MLRLPHRACGIEEFALELRWDRVPLHDDGRAEAAKRAQLVSQPSTPRQRLSADDATNRAYIVRKAMKKFGCHTEGLPLCASGSQLKGHP